MAFSAKHLVESYAQGLPYEINGQHELQAAEHVIASTFAVMPKASVSDLALADLSWRNRPDLAKTLCDRKFLGSLTGIVIEPLEDAVTELRTEKYTGGRQSSNAIRSATGFLIRATLSSRSLGSLGQTIRPVWLLPRSRSTIYDGTWRRVIGAERGDQTFDQAHKAAVKRSTSTSGGRQVQKRAGSGILNDGSDSKI